MLSSVSLAALTRGTSLITMTHTSMTHDGRAERSLAGCVVPRILASGGIWKCGNPSGYHLPEGSSFQGILGRSPFDGHLRES